MTEIHATALNHGLIPCFRGFTQFGGRQLLTLEDRQSRIVTEVVDPTSDRPARRVLRDGTEQPVSDMRGVTFYGPDQRSLAAPDLSWPTFDDFRVIAPDYAYLVDHIDACLAQGYSRWDGLEDPAIDAPDAESEPGGPIPLSGPAAQ